MPEVPEVLDAVLPAPPPEILSAAKVARGQWLTELDPLWADEEEVPAWAVVGEWQSDSRGQVVAWRANDDYRPSPLALGWPDPTDPVDQAMQWAATGHGPVEAVLRALVEAEEVAVLTTLDGSFVTALSQDDAEVVPVYTAADQMLGVGRLTARTAPVAELLDGLPDGHEFYLNPAGPVAMRVRTEALREALARPSAEAERPEDLSPDLAPPFVPVPTQSAQAEEPLQASVGP
ncbi:type VII secretion system-associated protein [Streptomyces olivaceoviridis]|uniref:type VII secretion system-associated protein n=1 Tax=Streptomyces olivaceoviridis TaxID=1921 RepID=UPI0036CED0A2